MAEISHLLRIIAAYCEATGRTESTVSTRFLGAGSRAAQLRGGSDMATRRLAGVLADFSAHWPADAVWPPDVPRPAPRQAAE